MGIYKQTYIVFELPFLSPAMLKPLHLPPFLSRIHLEFTIIITLPLEA